MLQRFSPILLICLMIMAVGCGRAQKMAVAAPVAVRGGAWGACPPALAAPEGVECAVRSVPLAHGGRGRSIDVVTARAAGRADRKVGQLWLLAGGPGESVRSLLPLMAAWARKYPMWDYYAMEHRGVGASTGLECRGRQDWSRGCGEALKDRFGREGLAHFSTDGAAHDLAALMRAFPADGRRFVCGLSYGTLVAQRLLQLHPGAVDGAILDSPVPVSPLGDELPFDRYDSRLAAYGQKIMDECAADQACAARFAAQGLIPDLALPALFARIDAGGHCPAVPKLDRERMRHALAGLAGSATGAQLLPAAVLRALRCDAKDAPVLSRLSARFAKPAVDSPALAATVALSSLLGPIPLAEAEAFSATATISPDETLLLLRTREQGRWPVPPPVSLAPSAVPGGLPSVLILSGARDPRTPPAFARAVDESFGRAGRFVDFPHGGHMLVLTSRLPGQPPGFSDWDTCGARIMFRFMEDPDGILDTSCSRQLPLPDYAGATGMAREAAASLFGTPEPWE